MVEIIVGECVVNKVGEVGNIAAFDGRYVSVDYQNRVAKYESNAFEKGFIKYFNNELQDKVEESIALAAAEKKRKEEEARLSAEKEAQKTKPARAAGGCDDVRIESSVIMIEPTPVYLNSVHPIDRALVEEVFSECDKHTKTLFESFKPKMAYPKYTSHSRSKYCVGFLDKHLDTYVFRVFSRNDVYKKRVKSGVTVFESNTAEVLRVLQVKGKLYYFSKNIAISDYRYNNTTGYNKWRGSDMGTMVFLNEVLCNCDCGYLNGHITDKSINIQASLFIRLLFPALINNKVEIAFKNKAFASSDCIDDLILYLEAFTPKQIDFASKNDVLHALPFIKRFGVSDIPLLRDLETVMKKTRSGVSIRNVLKRHFDRIRADSSDLDRRLMNFVKNAENFNAAIYYEYLDEFYYIPATGISVQDLFDRNYIQRHEQLLQERLARRNGLSYKDAQKDSEEYREAAKALSWIDREENGYFIMMPKTVAEFKYEGDMQHNCVHKLMYYRYVTQHSSVIVFLRKKKDVPFVTIEYDYQTFEVRQALGKYNSKIAPELYQYIVNLGKRLYYEMHSYQ